MNRQTPSRNWAATRLLFALALAAAAVSISSSRAPSAYAQGQAQAQKQDKQDRRDCPPTTARPSVVESGRGAEASRSGDVFVRATENTHMTVPLAMSKGSVILVEFPAADPLYSFHEGNSKMAFVNCGQDRDGSSDGGPRRCMTRPTDPLVLQPGVDFAPPANGCGDDTAAFVSVQRVSGMVVTFMIYPVRTAAESATRVVVSYDVREVMAARQKAGLLTQLVPAEALAGGGVPANSPLLSQPAAPAASPTPAATPPPSPEELLSERVVTELRRVAQTNPAPQFSKPVHGLAIAVLGGPPPTSDTSIQVVALRNTLAVPVRLLPDQPELRVMQAARKGEAILDQSVAVRHIATTVGDDNVLRPNEVYYFAVAYDQPALGVKQSIYVSFAHMLASDEPATAPLTSLLAAR
jgi:hypothetical protein